MIPFCHLNLTFSPPFLIRPIPVVTTLHFLQNWRKEISIFNQISCENSSNKKKQDFYNSLTKDKPFGVLKILHRTKHKYSCYTEKVGEMHAKHVFSLIELLQKLDYKRTTVSVIIWMSITWFKTKINVVVMCKMCKNRQHEIFTMLH